MAASGFGDEDSQHEQPEQHGSGVRYDNVTLSDQARGHFGNNYHYYDRSNPRDQLLEALYSPWLDDRKDSVKAAAPNTFNWIFNEPDDQGIQPQPGQTWRNKWTKQRPDVDFEGWLRSKNSLYWISGKPGSGKSTLMGFILDDERTMKSLEIWAAGCTVSVLSFFFWRAGHHLHTSTIGLLRGILYQLCQGLPEQAHSNIYRQLLRQLGITGTRPAAWGEKMLLRAIRTFLGAASGLNYCIFIDGLDEFVGDYDDLLDIVETFQQFETVKLCVSSRPEVLIRDRLHSAQQLRLQDLNWQDISNFVEGKFKRIPTWLDDEIALMNKIIHRARGVFLWTALVTKTIISGRLSGDDFSMLSERLDAMPTEMDQLLDRMMNSVDPLHLKSLGFYISMLRIGETDHSVRTWSIAEVASARVQGKEQLSHDRFERLCRQTVEQIQGQSAGLLEINDRGIHSQRKVIRGLWVDKSRPYTEPRDQTTAENFITQHDTSLHPFAHMLRYEALSYSWIHRSAYDFCEKYASTHPLQFGPFEGSAELYGRLWRGQLEYITMAHSAATLKQIACPKSAMSTHIAGKIDKLFTFLKSGQRHDFRGAWSILDQLYKLTQVMGDVETIDGALTRTPGLPSGPSRPIRRCATAFWFQVLGSGFWSYILARAEQIQDTDGSLFFEIFAMSTIMHDMGGTVDRARDDDVATQSTTHEWHEPMLFSRTAPRKGYALTYWLLKRSMHRILCGLRALHAQKGAQTYPRAWANRYAERGGNFRFSESFSYVLTTPFQPNKPIQDEILVVRELLTACAQWREFKGSYRWPEGEYGDYMMSELDSLFDEVFEVIDLRIQVPCVVSPSACPRRLSIEIRPAFARSAVDWYEEVNLLTGPTPLLRILVFHDNPSRLRCGYIDTMQRTILDVGIQASKKLLQFVNPNVWTFGWPRPALDLVEPLFCDLWSSGADLSVDERIVVHAVIESEIQDWCRVKQPFGDADLVDINASFPARWSLPNEAPTIQLPNELESRKSYVARRIMWLRKTWQGFSEAL